MSAPEERPWTVDEAAHFLSFKPETIRRWARGGKLASLGQVAGEWRFDPAAVRAMLHGSVKLPSSARVIEAQMNAAYTRVMRARGKIA